MKPSFSSSSSSSISQSPLRMKNPKYKTLVPARVSRLTPPRPLVSRDLESVSISRIRDSASSSSRVSEQEPSVSSSAILISSSLPSFNDLTFGPSTPSLPVCQFGSFHDRTSSRTLPQSPFSLSCVPPASPPSNALSSSMPLSPVSLPDCAVKIAFSPSSSNAAAIGLARSSSRCVDVFEADPSFLTVCSLALVSLLVKPLQSKQNETFLSIFFHSFTLLLCVFLCSCAFWTKTEFGWLDSADSGYVDEHDVNSALSRYLAPPLSSTEVSTV